MDDLPELTWGDIEALWDAGNYAEEERKAKLADAAERRLAAILGEGGDE